MTLSSPTNITLAPPIFGQTVNPISTRGADYSAAASGWAGWALAHPEFGSSVNPITTRGADYAHHITDSPPGFENPAASLLSSFCTKLLSTFYYMYRSNISTVWKYFLDFQLQVHCTMPPKIFLFHEKSKIMMEKIGLTFISFSDALVFISNRFVE